MIAIGETASEPEWSGVVYLVAMSDIVRMALTWYGSNHGAGSAKQVLDIIIGLTYLTERLIQRWVCPAAIMIPPGFWLKRL
jgi:hypothetical protein